MPIKNAALQKPNTKTHQEPTLALLSNIRDGIEDLSPRRRAKVRAERVLASLQE
jgi:hypothetical protein